MKKNEEQTSEGLNQIFEIINAKGDVAEINFIMEEHANNEFETEESSNI